jgi:2-polyprenyl-3-methyl-5-hydroxy-6-metoxy-1,4-benzoquinol methylase
MEIIKEELKKYQSILDLGCGKDSPLCREKRRCEITGVDNYEISKVHDKFYKNDVLNINQIFKENSFDCVMAMDLIEHLTKEEGIELIEKMIKIAKEKIIIYTPNGFVDQDAFDGNPNQIHKSGWDYKEMQNLGFKVWG